MRMQPTTQIKRVRRINKGSSGLTIPAQWLHIICGGVYDDKKNTVFFNMSFNPANGEITMRPLRDFINTPNAELSINASPYAGAAAPAPAPKRARASTSSPYAVTLQPAPPYLEQGNPLNMLDALNPKIEEYKDIIAAYPAVKKIFDAEITCLTSDPAALASARERVELVYSSAVSRGAQLPEMLKFVRFGLEQEVKTMVNRRAAERAKDESNYDEEFGL